MSLLRKIWEKNRENFFFNFFLRPLKNIYDIYRYRVQNERKFIEKSFYRNHGYRLDLDNPKTLNEKIQWLKLYERTNFHTDCADKIKVRDIIKNILGEKYLIPMIFETSNVLDLREENFPEYPCIVKTNHDSGTYVIIKDKSEVDFKKIRKFIRKKMKINFYYSTKEWQYKNIKPRIIVEKLLLDEKGEIPFDYKVHCINGKVEMISVDIDRGTDKHRRSWYDSEWKRLPFHWSSVIKGNQTIQSKKEISRPVCLDEMISVSQKIASLFNYVRVDWYQMKSKIYFGELTFHHDSGMKPIVPYEFDLKYGEKLKLN